MQRLISKKLVIDDNNDSLLEEPMFKKFIGVSEKMQAVPQPIKNKLNFKLIRPDVASRTTSRKKIITQSPSSSRISFFTKYHQSRLDPALARNPKSEKQSQNSSSLKQSSKLLFRSLNPNPPKMDFIRRRLSIGTLKPKAQVQRIMLIRRKNVLDNPFLISHRQSDYL